MRLARLGGWCVLLGIAAAVGTATAAPATPEKPASEPGKSVQPPMPGQSAEAAARHDRELANYLRRLDVCLELRQLAQQTGDAELERRVDQLESRAFEVYKQRMAQPVLPPAPQPVQRLTEKPPREHRSTAPWARSSRRAAHADEEDQP
jgi:hypothetical protein